MEFESGYSVKAIKRRISLLKKALKVSDSDDIGFERSDLEMAVKEAAASVPQNVLDEAKSLLQSI